MKIFKKISLGALLVESVLGVLSHFEKNSAFSKVSVFWSIFDVQKMNLYHLKGHKIVYP